MDPAFVRTALAVVALGTAPLTVAAQRPVSQDTAGRPAVDSGRTASLSPIVVTGARVPTRVGNLVFAASVLNADGLRHEPTPSAATALSRLPSVAINEGAGVAGPTVLRLRGGEESFSQVLFDGIPLNLTGGFMDLQGLTLTNVDRIEVARGAQSAMYGSSAMAGAVQFLTRQGQPGRPRITLTGEGGTSADQGGQAHSELAVAGGSERVRYSAAGAGTYFRGIYDLPHDLRTWEGSARVDADLGSAWELTGTFRYMDIASNLPVRDPGVTRAPLDPNQRDGRTRLLSSAALRFHPGAHWSHAVAVKAYRDDFFYEDQADGLDPAEYPFFVFDFNFGYTSVQWRKTAEYAGAWSTGAAPTALTLAFGGKYELEDLSVVQNGDFGDAESAYDRTNGAGYVELQGRVGARFDVLAGARYERFEGLAGAWLPRGGVGVTLVPDRLKLRGSIGRAFKAPNLEQQYLDNPFTAPNPDLAPETSVSWEAGLLGTIPEAGFVARGTFFHQTYDDLIRLVPFDTAGRAQNQNLGKSRVLGVETEIEKWWGSRWRAVVGVNWLHSEMVENIGLSEDLYPVGSVLLAVPDWTGNVLLEGDLTRVFSASVRGRIVGEQEVLTERFAGERVAIDPYVLLGITVRARIGALAVLYVRGENLLDTDYATAYDRPGLPLTVIGGFQVMTP